MGMAAAIVCRLRHVGSICATFSVALLGVDEARGSDEMCLRVFETDGSLVTSYLGNLSNSRALFRMREI